MKCGETAEKKFLSFLEENKIEARKVGQENWLVPWVHEKLKYVNNDPLIKIIRHFPDVSTEKSLVQVKSAPQ
jgi:hypothetical protein